MQASILIVSHNRSDELRQTLSILEGQIDKTKVEIIVYLDGCTDDSASLQQAFPWSHWILSPACIGASAARAKLYPMAQSEIIIGMDDDAHFLTVDFLAKITTIFDLQPNTAIIAFEEVKGVFRSDDEAIKHASQMHQQYYCSEFIGCGFAIRKSMYLQTNGFPTWIDIYGEESCLSIEIIDCGFDIVFDNSIKVNHRVNVQERKSAGKHYFRFEKQLKNVTRYYIVYYKNPLFSILKLYFHNFTKYARTDFTYFKIYFKVIFQILFNLPKVLKFRKPVKHKTILKLKSLANVQF